MTVLATLASVVLLGLGLARAPYMGVACHRASTTTCGRIGVAVWLRGNATAVEAKVGKARVRLTRPPAQSPGAPWIGYVHLPLRAMGLPASWTGPAKRLLVHIRVRRAGVWRAGVVVVPLNPGWG